MAIEQNPFEAITQATSNVVNLPTAEETTEATFEVEPDGGVLVDFSQEIEMSPDEDIAEWYGNLAEDIEVQKAQLKNGLLSIRMERIVPDEKKPQKIKLS